MNTVEVEFPFAKDLEAADEAMLPELTEMNETWKAENGLVPAAALKEIFQISKQAAHKLPGKYGLTEYNFFDKKWYSRAEVEALHKMERPAGFKGSSMAAMGRDCLDDARKD